MCNADVLAANYGRWLDAPAPQRGADVGDDRGVGGELDVMCMRQRRQKEKSGKLYCEHHSWADRHVRLGWFV